MLKRFLAFFFVLFRFKNHLFDLTFMEKVTRWLTNTQVKVKSEVRSSYLNLQLVISGLQNSWSVFSYVGDNTFGLIDFLIYFYICFQVAFSNSQAKKLAIYLSTFERHIDAVEKPNLDKEVRTKKQKRHLILFWLKRS